MSQMTSNFLSALMDHTNCYANSSSLSTILIKNPIDFSSPQLHLVNHYYETLRSFCKHQLQFELKDAKYKSSRPVIRPQAAVRS